MLPEEPEGKDVPSIEDEFDEKLKKIREAKLEISMDPQEIEALDKFTTEGKTDGYLDPLPSAEETSHLELEQINAEFEAKLSELDARQAAFKRRQEQKKAEVRRSLDSTKGLGVGLAVAYVFTGVPMVGVGAGWGLSRLLNDPRYLMWGAAVGSCLGLVLAITLLARLNK